MDSIIGGICPWAAGGYAEGLFGGLFQLLLASYCAIHNPEIWPVDKASLLLSGAAPAYDFIVVGAGSAGSAVARRLAEDNWNVLLLEAGQDPTPESEIPAMAHGTQTTSINWGYRSEPNPRYCQAMKNRQCHIPRGKALGGSSAINYMLYVRGVKEDYDEWESLGNEGWNYESVMKYFRKLEKLNAVTNYNDVSRSYGTDGLVNIDSYDSEVPLKDFIKSAWKELGYKVMDHINEDHLSGITVAYGTIQNGQRWSSAKAYLTGYDKNVQEHLHVVRNAHVTKLLIDENTKAVFGVSVKINGKDLEIKASKEVVLSAGAIGTPQILMLSGIGPREHLEQVGAYPVIADLPVGQGLGDHILTPVILTPDKSNGALSQEASAQILIDYLLKRKGLLGSVGITDLIGYLNTNEEEHSPPDLQIVHFYATQNDSLFLPNLIAGFMYDEEYANQMLEAITEADNIYLLPTLLKPKSKGRIELRSTDPLEAPIIHMEHFKEKEDLDTIVKGVKFCEKIVETETFKQAGWKIRHTKLKACPFEFKTDEYWKCMITQLASTVYHQVGTARMGPKNDKRSVVDSTLKVHGVKGVRVVDASIMPEITRGNTNAPSIMIGEKGADLIKNDWRKYPKSEL